VFLNDGTKLEKGEVKLVGKSTDADIAVIHVSRSDLAVAIGSKVKPTIATRTIMIDGSSRTRGAEVKAGLVTNDVTEVQRGEEKPMYGLVQVTTRASVSPRSPGTV